MTEPVKIKGGRTIYEGRSARGFSRTIALKRVADDQEIGRFMLDMYYEEHRDGSKPVFGAMHLDVPYLGIEESIWHVPQDLIAEEGGKLFKKWNFEIDQSRNTFGAPENGSDS